MSMCASNDMLLRRAEGVLQESLQIGIAPLVEHVKIVSAEPGEVYFKFEVTKKLLNTKGYLHGGVLSLLVDTLTFVSARVLFPFRGVSINLNANFVKGIKHGETVYAKAVAVRAGKKMVFAEVHFRDVDGILKAYGGQTIYVMTEENSSQVNSTTQIRTKSDCFDLMIDGVMGSTRHDC